MTITFLARSHHNSADFALISFVNRSGWSNSVIPVLVGLSTSAVSIIAFDSVSHMAEELEQPAKDIPGAMLTAYYCNAVLAFAFVLALLFTTRDLSTII